MVLKDQKVAVVTGCSTGIGLETCLLFARNGILTYATMRDLNKSELIEKVAEKEGLPLKVIRMDVNRDDSVAEAIQKILYEGRGIDILVNNAGFGLFGALEDLRIEDIKKQFETNVFGAIRTIQQVLPVMRNQRSGIIVNISSMSGYIGFPASSAYVSTKFALEGLSESLAYEVAPYSIKVVLIEPGVVNTNFVENIMIPDNTQQIWSSQLASLSPASPKHTISTGNSDNPKSQREITKYAEVVESFLSHYYSAMRNAPAPKDVAKVVLYSIEAALDSTSEGVNLFRYPVGEDAKLYAEARRKMNDSELHAFVAKRTLS
ncbi:MAG TPA: SDR family oxidoreductase [Candidatus Nitrosopolaris sp.]|nr:SDR family oxidoreductase [Candidatus Nitrosopolaris sp.]